MFLHRSSDYAFQGLLPLVRAKGRALPLHRIARECHLAKDYLYKIFRRLCAHGILRASPGKKRGYVLAKPPEEISLLEIVEAVEGELAALACVPDPSLCPKSVACRIRAALIEGTDRLREVLGSVSLQEAMQAESDSPPEVSRV